MDQPRLQLLISRGMTKGAAILGRTLPLYRPLTPMDPLLPGSAIGTVLCSIDSSADFKFIFPQEPDQPFSLLLADTSLLQTGDYLVANRTYFVSRIEVLKPAWCVVCNKTLDVLDTGQSFSVGTNSYGGITIANNTLLARGWPVSMRAKGRSEVDVTKLPSDTRAAFYDVWMPTIPGLLLALGLVLRDEIGQIYVIMSFDTTAYGSKLLVGLATT